MVGNTELLNNKIETYIFKLFETHQLNPGDRLPSEREFGRMFNSSIMPVRQAMEKFVNIGVLEKKHGKGASAMDIVRADLEKKYGKGAILGGKKKKEDKKDW